MSSNLSQLNSIKTVQSWSRRGIFHQICFVLTMFELSNWKKKLENLWCWELKKSFIFFCDSNLFFLFLETIAGCLYGFFFRKSLKIWEKFNFRGDEDFFFSLLSITFSVFDIQNTCFLVKKHSFFSIKIIWKHAVFRFCSNHVQKSFSKVVITIKFIWHFVPKSFLRNYDLQLTLRHPNSNWAISQEK